MTAVARQAVAQTDPRLAAFCDRNGPEVFSAIVHSNQIWTPDPFDVESIHAEARVAFTGLLNRAAGPVPPPAGKTLLLLGEAGSGKTHLMRAFRTEAHSSATGYCGYLQMTTRGDNYARYVHSNLIDALEQPYLHPNPLSGLSRLARGLLDSLDMISSEERQRLCTDLLEPPELAEWIHRFADFAVQDARFAQVDLDLIRAVLYLLPNDGRIRPRVLKWLRCEDLSRYDRELLGDLVPRARPEMPLRTIVGLGQLMAAVHQAALVLCVDQLEETIDQVLPGKGTDRWELFRQAVNTLIDITDAVPTAVVVVACLEDLFQQGRPFLPQAKLDRLERDPDSLRLSSRRSPEEIAALVGRRLEVLYEAFDVAADPQSQTFPYTPAHLKRLEGLRTRDILDFCRRHREKCVQAGAWVEPDGDRPPAPPPPSPSIKLEQEWNDFLAAFEAPVLDDECQLAELLAWTIRAVSAEMPGGIHFGAEADGRFIPVEVHHPGNVIDKLLVAVCERNPRGGGLGRQLDEVVKRAGDTPAAIVLSTAFPASPRAEVSKRLASLIEPRGRWRRRVVENSDWRAMAAFRDFHERHKTRPDFAGWQKGDRPLSELAAVRAILALDKLVTAAPVPAPRPPEPPPPPVSPPQPVTPAPFPARPGEAGPLFLGVTRGLSAAPVTVEPKELTQHAAFLGGSGSGKTTAALTLIEQLVARGVPAVLLDRKGDLARYADPAAWTAPREDAARAERRRRLRERIDVTVFTPGNPTGRPLTLPVVPADLGQLPVAEREQIAGYAAAALAGMMGYKLRGTDPKLAILGKAIEVLAARPGRAVTVRDLKQLVEDRDEALLLAVDGFDDRHYKKLAEDLLTLCLQRQRLLEGAAGELLDVGALLGHGPYARPGRTRLSVINTQFLGDTAVTDFWVAQFLIAIDRWASRNPSPERLQAVFLFDEADQYLPATRQPATKAPMENLLRRARSKGVGLFLATQSPGDLDYKCRDQIRTWLVGRVKEKVAIDKLRPMLEVGRIDAAAKLPGQEAGQFYLLREKDVAPVQVEPSLVATAQLPEDRILELARDSRAGGVG
jgi:hypothetical protein